MSFGCHTFIVSFASEHAASYFAYSTFDVVQVLVQDFNCALQENILLQVFLCGIILSYFMKFLHNPLHNYMIKCTDIYHLLCHPGIVCNKYLVKNRVCCGISNLLCVLQEFTI